MPDARHSLSDEDIKWLRESYSKSKRKLSLFRNDELEAIKKLLERSKNGLWM